MEDNKLPEIEKNIYKKIDYSNKRFKIRAKYTNDGLDTRVFKVNEVKNIFKEMDIPYEYLGDGTHRIKVREYKDYSAFYNFIVTQNTVNIYLYIYKKEKLIAPAEPNAGYVLHYIGYDKDLADKLNKSFGINSFEDLKNYILDNKRLCDEFVDEYFKEINAGNAPQ